MQDNSKKRLPEDASDWIPILASLALVLIAGMQTGADISDPGNLTVGLVFTVVTTLIWMATAPLVRNKKRAL